MKDYIEDGYLVHEVKKVWNGIVSCGDYTIAKCDKANLGLRLVFKGTPMSIKRSIIEQKLFRLHNKTIISKYGQNYKMCDFGWKPDTEINDNN